MSISGLLLLSAMQGPAATAPLIPSFFTGEGIYEICRRPNAGQCSMYVAGVLDGIFLARSQPEDHPLCPSRMTNQEAAEMVTRYIEDNPDMHPRAAAVGVNEALASRLACPSDSPETAAAADGAPAAMMDRN